MTQLFIDGTEVLLPEDFNVDYIIENPFFTRRGEYTYDIDIDLRILQNRKIYQFAGRADAVKRPRNREARMVCDGVTVAHGTEVILSIDNNIAKIQIVSGNSELNYISKGDLKLRELDLGSFVVNLDTAYASLKGCYPEFDFVCTPISLDGRVGRENSYLNHIIIPQKSYKYDSETKLVAQPYLLSVIKKVITALGYTITVNELETDDRWRRLFIVNGFETTELAKMLPEWTVDEFLDEVEKYFNCIFDVNQFDKTVKLINVNNYYSNKDTVYIDTVMDESVVKTYDSKSPLAITYDNVTYAFPSYDRYKYMKLSEGLEQVFQRVEKTHYYDNWNTIEQDILDKKMYVCNDYNFKAVGRKFSDAHFGIDIIDQFKDIRDSTSENVTELKIIPAEMIGKCTRIVFESLQLAGYFTVYARNCNPIEDEEKDNDIHSIIKNGIKVEKGGEDMFVALYGGEQPVYKVVKENPTEVISDVKIPMSLVDTYAYCADKFVKPPHEYWRDGLIIFPDSKLTLRLEGPNGLYNSYYRYSMDIDTSTEYEFDFISNSIPDQRSIFVIANKMYFCKRLTTRIFASGRDKVIHGNFYLMT